MSLNGPVDQLLCFGEAALASASALPDTVNVGKSQTEQMKVEVLCTENASGGASVTFTLKGSETAQALLQ